MRKILYIAVIVGGLGVFALYNAFAQYRRPGNILTAVTNQNYTEEMTFIPSSTVSSVLPTSGKQESTARHPLYCYEYKNAKTIAKLAETEPARGQSVFFIESSCASQDAGRIVLSPRQACAVESAARMNPERQVFLLMLSPGELGNSSDENDRTLRSLASYPNVRIRHIDLDGYMRAGPLQDLRASGKLKRSRWAVHHVSDVLRYLTLWKFGGIYMDLDVVVTSHLAGFPDTFTARESVDSLGAGVIGFGADGLHHQWLQMCLDDINTNFNGSLWSYNANGALERLLNQICNNTPPAEMNKEKCNGFEIFEPEDFYPIPFREWEKFFQKQYLAEVLSTVTSVKIFHVWNKFSSGTRIIKNEFNAAYEILASVYCPKVYKSCDKYF